MAGAIWKGPYPKDHPMKSGRYSINLGRLLEGVSREPSEDTPQNPSEDSKITEPEEDSETTPEKQ